MTIRRAIVAITLGLLLLPALALADPESDVRFRGWGPRVGLSLDPDQIHFGADMDFGNFARHVRFQPNVEVGFGDNVTLIAINFEAAYRFQSRWDVWTPYLGGGPGLNFGRWHSAHWPGNSKGHDDSFTGVGFNILGGVERGLRNGDRFFAEAKLGFSDAPDLKLTIGWTFFP
ncbi:MAG: hypothetical protein HZB43_03190 [candidate division Zixibacteria bacterium]|nr:hypothetical protein [candidate division Zixibacteria bacterium]